MRYKSDLVGKIEPYRTSPPKRLNLVHVNLTRVRIHRLRARQTNEPLVECVHFGHGGGLGVFAQCFEDRFRVRDSWRE